MATLVYDANRPLAFGLVEAAERQKNGLEFTLASIDPVQAHSYDSVYNALTNNPSLRRVLRRINTANLKKLWEELIQSSLDGVYIPQGVIRLTPCIIKITEEYVVVAIPVYTEGATALQIETILSGCLVGEPIDCKGHELRIVLSRKEIGFDKEVTN